MTSVVKVAEPQNSKFFNFRDFPFPPRKVCNLKDLLLCSLVSLLWLGWFEAEDASPLPSLLPPPSPCTMRNSTLLVVLACLTALLARASPVTPDSSLAKRQNGVNYTDPNTNGGQMLTIIPELTLGEPINVIVSGRRVSSLDNIDSLWSILSWSSKWHAAIC
jgi:hypothetical protein